MRNGQQNENTLQIVSQTGTKLLSGTKIQKGMQRENQTHEQRLARLI